MNKFSKFFENCRSEIEFGSTYYKLVDRVEKEERKSLFDAYSDALDKWQASLPKYILTE